MQPLHNEDHKRTCGVVLPYQNGRFEFRIRSIAQVLIHDVILSVDVIDDKDMGTMTDRVAGNGLDHTFAALGGAIAACGVDVFSKLEFSAPKTLIEWGFNDALTFD